MNTGLQDAVNLGWKLAATAAGRAPAWLLDSYHDERYPVGQAVLALTGRQFRLNTARTARRRAVRWAAHRMIAPLPPVQDWLAATYSGVAIRYPPDGAGPAPDPALGPVHKLAGARLPRGTLDLAGGGTARLYGLFREGRFALLEAAGQDSSAGAAGFAGPGGASTSGTSTSGTGPGSAGRGGTGPGSVGPGGAHSASTGAADLVRRVRYRRCLGARLPAAVLARPDGYIAWASDERDASLRAGQARAAVRAWCGSA
jgi:hypothetical protein